MRFFLVLISTLVVFGFSPTSAAALLRFNAQLSGLQEVPPSATPGTGNANLSFDTVAQTLTVHIEYLGLLSTVTAAHIHCCAGVGVNAPIAIGLSGFPSATTAIYDQVFDLAQVNIYNASFLTTAGGTAAGAQSLLSNALFAENTYINIHSSTFPGGELRGQLIPVPAPATLYLFLLGMGLLSLGRMRWMRVPA